MDTLSFVRKPVNDAVRLRVLATSTLFQAICPGFHSLDRLACVVQPSPPGHGTCLVDSSEFN